MDTRTQLILSIIVLMSTYFGVASSFVTESRTRLDDIATPTAASPARAAGRTAPVCRPVAACHAYDLFVRFGTHVVAMDQDALRLALLAELGRRFDGLRLQPIAERLPRTDRGAIVVTVDEWHDSESSCGPYLVPGYLALRVEVFSAGAGAAAGYGAMLNSDVAPAARDRGLTPEQARVRQVERLVADAVRTMVQPD